MTIEEVINATTKNTAYAMGLENELGSIAKGKKANLFITKAIPTYAFLQYNFGQNELDLIQSGSSAYEFRANDGFSTGADYVKLTILDSSDEFVKSVNLTTCSNIL